MNSFQHQSDVSATDGSVVDLDWMAFQYVSGDLSDHDVIRFEELLANDLSACEAVARQVMICETAATTTTATTTAASAASPGAVMANGNADKATPQSDVVVFVSPTSVQSADRPISRWIGVASAAACLGLAVSLGLLSPLSPGVSSNGQRASVSMNDQLVQYWVDVKRDVDEPVDLLSSQTDEPSIWDDVEQEELVANDDELMPADWMLAAVSTSGMEDELDMPEEVFE